MFDSSQWAADILGCSRDEAINRLANAKIKLDDDANLVTDGHISCPECGAMAGVEFRDGWVECPECGKVSDPRWDELTSAERSAILDGTEQVCDDEEYQ